MVKLKCWEKFEGMESPGWYNVRFINKKTKKEIILSNSGKNEGTDEPNDKWTVGFVDKHGQPIGDQKEFENKTKAESFVEEYMRKHNKCRK